MKLTERLKKPYEWLKMGIIVGLFAGSYFILDKIQQYRLDNSEIGQLMERVRTSSNPNIKKIVKKDMIIYELTEPHPYSDMVEGGMSISVTLEDVPPLNQNSVGDRFYGQNISPLNKEDFIGGSEEGITGFLGIPRVPSENMNWGGVPKHAKTRYIGPLKEILK